MLEHLSVIMDVWGSDFRSPSYLLTIVNVTICKLSVYKLFIIEALELFFQVKSLRNISLVGIFGFLVPVFFQYRIKIMKVWRKKM